MRAELFQKSLKGTHGNKAIPVRVKEEMDCNSSLHFLVSIIHLLSLKNSFLRLSVKEFNASPHLIVGWSIMKANKGPSHSGPY